MSRRDVQHHYIERDDDDEPELPAGYASWEEVVRDETERPTEADHAALDRAYRERER